MRVNGAERRKVVRVLSGLPGDRPAHPLLTHCSPALLTQCSPLSFLLGSGGFFRLNLALSWELSPLNL
jgi:hypothetical protein